MARRTNTRNPFEVAQSTETTLLDQATVALRFDYESLPAEHREAVRRSALAIKPQLKRTAEAIFVIGRELDFVKSKIAYGAFTDWLDTEFGLSVTMAQRFMRVASRLGSQKQTFLNLSPTVLYELAAPSTPDEAIEEVEEQIKSSERISVAYVQDIIRQAKIRQRQQTPGMVTIEGEVLSSNGVTHEELTHRTKGQRINQALDAILRQLDASLLADWQTLFDDDELLRLYQETLRLQQRLATQIKQPTAT